MAMKALDKRARNGGRRKGAGRKPRGGVKRSSVSLWLSDELVEQLRGEAAVAGISLGEAVEIAAEAGRAWVQELAYTKAAEARSRCKSCRKRPATAGEKHCAPCASIRPG